MGWEKLIDALDELETEVEYDGYFCSIQDAVIIVTLASMCELKSVMRIHSWATTETVSTFLAQAFGINISRCSASGLLIASLRQKLQFRDFKTGASV